MVPVTGIDLHFRPGMDENKGIAGTLPGDQQSNGMLDLIGSIPVLYFYSKKENHPGGMALFLEQGTGIEPAFTAWEAVVLPIYEPCVGMYYSRAE